MKLFASWSGGKDCTLALYRILQQKQHEVSYLINMCDVDGQHSRSHGMHKHLIAHQASLLGIPILQPETNSKLYESEFKNAIAVLKDEGVTGGVFGDIYLQVHRDWIERVCADMDIQPFFPLWENNTAQLIEEFVAAGFKTLVVAVNTKHLPKLWLGRTIDTQFINDILGLKGIDPCAENGEYHSFVYDGPLFSQPLPYTLEKSYKKDNHWFLEVK
jgi:diphthine-ammonia ligase